MCVHFKKLLQCHLRQNTCAGRLYRQEAGKSAFVTLVLRNVSATSRFKVILWPAGNVISNEPWDYSIMIKTLINS